MVECHQRVGVQVWSRAAGAVGIVLDPRNGRRVAGAPVANAPFGIDRGWEPEPTAAVEVGVTPEAFLDRLPTPARLSGVWIEQEDCSAGAALVRVKGCPAMSGRGR